MPTAISTMRTLFSSVTEMVEARAQEFPDYEIVGVPDKSFHFSRYTYRHLDETSTRLAHYYTDAGFKPRTCGDTTTQLVVALLAPSGFDYIVNELALVKMGYCALFLSINNSVPALAHLLKATSALKIVAAPSHWDAANEAIALVKEQGVELDCEVVPIAPKTAWDKNDSPKLYVRALTPEQEGPLPAFIVHSSGSTGFPKPIYITHKATCHNSVAGFGLTSFTTLPLFHNHGHSCFYRAVCGRRSICLFPSDIPLITANINAALQNAGPVEGLYVVPYVLKLLAETDAGIELLQSFKLVTYGGAACPDELGDKLVREHGVRLVGHYGSTEVGQLATSLREFDTDQDWNYIRFQGPQVTTNINQYIHLEPRGDLLEVVVKDGWPGKVFNNLPDGGYATKDLFVGHPTTRGAYKFVGRLDDTLVQVNGEKTNPVPIELTLKGESPYIAEAVVFGAGRPHIGALILPTELAKDLTPAQFFPLIWPTIQLANEAAPSHSRLLPEMLIYLKYNTKLPRADKGSVIRPRTYVQFEAAIEELYHQYDNGEATIPGQETQKRKMEGEALARFITASITSVMGTPPESLSPEADLFDYGVDSIQAARIRSVLQRDLELLGRRLPGNLVFEQPTVKRLVSYLERAQSGAAEGAVDATQQDEQVGKMKELVQRYSTFAERPVVSGPDPVSKKRTVVLTGATGSLGAHLLHQLLKREDVASVVCLARGNNHAEARARVCESLAARGLPSVEALSNESRLVVYAADLAEADLGLGANTYERLRSAVTTIIHNGWAVNFTLNVESFEKGNIRAAYNLLNLAITARSGRPAAFFFSSSVSAVAAHKGRTIREVVSTDPLDAQGMGYARSKWVTENLVAKAAISRGIRAESFRLGQMVGDTVNGVWNETEAISLLVKSAQTIGAMPDLGETLSWLPVDFAAQACIEVINASPGPTPGMVWHILNASTSTTWKTVFAALGAAGIKFEVVPRREWVRRLRDSERDLKRNPTYKLVDFFAAKYDHELSTCRADYSIEETSKVSAVVASRPDVDLTVIGRFIEAWRRSGFLV